MFKPFTAAEYRSLDHDAFMARRSEVIDLMNSEQLPEGVTDEALFAEADLIEAEVNRRNRVNELRNAQVTAVINGAGTTIAATGSVASAETEIRAMPKPEASAERGVREVTDVRGFTDSIEYRKALAQHIMHQTPMSRDFQMKALQERADQSDVTVPGSFTNMVDTFTNTNTTLVAVPFTVSDEVVRELKVRSNIFNLINRTSFQGQYAMSEADLNIDFTWLGSDKKVSGYQSDEDPESFVWAWNQLEARFSRTFLAQALMSPNYANLLGEAFADGYALAIDDAVINGTGNLMPKGILNDARLVGTDGEGIDGNGGGKVLIIDVSDDEIDDWKFWSTILYNDKFNPMYAGTGQLIIGRGTWGNHVDVLHDDNNRPISLSDPLTQSTGLTLRGVGPVVPVHNNILPSYDSINLDGDGSKIFAIYGNLRNYTMNFQPGMPISTVSWDDHETNTHKTKMLVACDGRVSNRYGWVFLRKVAGA